MAWTDLDAEEGIPRRGTTRARSSFSSRASFVRAIIIALVFGGVKERFM
jgi:hypothetical protein